MIKMSITAGVNVIDQRYRSRAFGAIKIFRKHFFVESFTGSGSEMNPFDILHNDYMLLMYGLRPLAQTRAKKQCNF